MNRVRCGKWVVDVDLEATRAAYATIATGDPESCGCGFCRNFVAARDLVYTPAVLDFYASFGIRADREAEVEEIGPPGPAGRLLYLGWHHLIGRIVKTSKRIVEITPEFGLSSFSDDCVGVGPAFSEAGPPVEVIFYATVPWLLEESP